jgi:hypothetical protein
MSMPKFFAAGGHGLKLFSFFALTIILNVAGAADDAVSKAAPAVQAATKTPADALVPPKPAAAKPVTAQTARQKCVARCERDNGLCNSDVRRGRQECSKKAANNGNNPLTGRPDDAYCGYFDGDHCGFYANRGACGQRFMRRYAECVDWMRGSIAAQRFDCFQAETKAQGLCRAELQDCQAACQ